MTFNERLILRILATLLEILAPFRWEKQIRDLCVQITLECHDAKREATNAKL